MKRMKDKVVLVTGAARGQGRSHCLALAREGAKIIGVDMCHSVDEVAYPLGSQEDLDETGRMIKELGADAVLMAADTRSRSELQEAVNAGLDQFGHIDVVVASAGVFTWGEAQHVSEADWQFGLDINLTGAFNTVQAVLPSMIDHNQGGSIMFTSSQLAMRGCPNTVTYSAAKAGLVGMMRALASELAPRSIRVNTIHPSNVDTPMVRNQAVYDLFAPDNNVKGTFEDVAAVGGIFHMLPIPLLNASDISNAVMFLASDESRAITGVEFPVDAGSTQKLG
uniref:mycofactocin-coupled SDR family oxidoreductase n=1 Tax=Rhodococcus qingshengii TaxID=334542 RepID=UPI002119D757|nr:mycofactocin-coupled SDR family oxidoreductase [Rhodococcus qingshengii]